MKRTATEKIIIVKKINGKQKGNRIVYQSVCNRLDLQRYRLFNFFHVLVVFFFVLVAVVVVVDVGGRFSFADGLFVFRLVIRSGVL